MGPDVEDEGVRVSEVMCEGGGWDGGEGVWGGWGTRWWWWWWKGVWGGELESWEIVGEETSSAEISGTEPDGDGVCKVVVGVVFGGG